MASSSLSSRCCLEGYSGKSSWLKLHRKKNKFMMSKYTKTNKKVRYSQEHENTFPTNTRESSTQVALGEITTKFKNQVLFFPFAIGKCPFCIESLIISLWSRNVIQICGLCGSIYKDLYVYNITEP